jgi:hypothetical protein
MVHMGEQRKLSGLWWERPKKRHRLKGWDQNGSQRDWLGRGVVGEVVNSVG